jgi:hypothetical protein
MFDEYTMNTHKQSDSGSSAFMSRKRVGAAAAIETV